MCVNAVLLHKCVLSEKVCYGCSSWSLWGALRKRECTRICCAAKAADSCTPQCMAPTIDCPLRRTRHHRNKPTGTEPTYVSLWYNAPWGDWHFQYHMITRGVTTDMLGVIIWCWKMRCTQWDVTHNVCIPRVSVTCFSMTGILKGLSNLCIAEHLLDSNWYIINQ